MKDNLYTGHFSERELNVIDTALLKYKFSIFDKSMYFDKKGKEVLASDYKEVSEIESRFTAALAHIAKNDFDKEDEI